MLQKTPNWKKDIDLNDKCGTCIHYKSQILKGKLTARGNCQLKNNQYVQRTETCKRYQVREG